MSNFAIKPPVYPPIKEAEGSDSVKFSSLAARRETRSDRARRTQV